MSNAHLLGLELLAVESVDGNVLDPQEEVPHAVLTETNVTLRWLAGFEAGPDGVYRRSIEA